MKRKLAALLLAASAAVAAAAYTGGGQSLPQAPSAKPRTASNLILLDPAHGGPDSGANLGGTLREKDVTLGFAAKLRSSLANANFNVTSTRDADPSVVLTTDQRAETANRLRPLACLILHATASGSGVHIYTSALPAAPDAGPDGTTDAPLVPWESAQAGSVEQSRKLASTFSSALTSAGVPVIESSAAVPPLDNMMCPAVAVEVAPASGSAVGDSEYQRRIIGALTSGLLTWQTHLVQPASPPTSGPRSRP